MDGFMILADVCTDIAPVIRLIKNVFLPVIYIGVPVLLIIFGALDLGKAVMGADEKAIKMATNLLIKRFIAAIAVFFVSTIVLLVMNAISGNYNGGKADEATTAIQKFVGCWGKI